MSFAGARFDAEKETDGATGNGDTSNPVEGSESVSDGSSCSVEFQAYGS